MPLLPFCTPEAGTGRIGGRDSRGVRSGGRSEAGNGIVGGAGSDSGRSLRGIADGGAEGDEDGIDDGIEDG